MPLKSNSSVDIVPCSNDIPYKKALQNNFSGTWPCLQQFLISIFEKISYCSISFIWKASVASVLLFQWNPLQFLSGNVDATSPCTFLVNKTQLFNKGGLTVRTCAPRKMSRILWFIYWRLVRLPSKYFTCQGNKRLGLVSFDGSCWARRQE